MASDSFKPCSYGIGCPGVIGFVCVLLLVVATEAAAQIAGRCVDVVDGDTLSVVIDQAQTTVRLWGVDAPELGQEWGEKARDHLSNLALDRDLTIDVRSEGPGLGYAVVVDHDRDLGRAMIEAGLAFLPRSRPTDDDYAAAIFVARAGKRGMWADSGSPPVHPDDWLAQRRAASIPTPTPIPSSLSDIAGDLEVAENANGAVITNKELDAKGISLPDSDYSRCLLPLIAEVNDAVQTMRNLTEGLNVPTDSEQVEALNIARNKFIDPPTLNHRVARCDSLRTRYDYWGQDHVREAISHYGSAAVWITKDVSRAWSSLTKGDVEMGEARKAFNEGYRKKQHEDAERNAGNPYYRW